MQFESRVRDIVDKAIHEQERFSTDGELTIDAIGKSAEVYFASHPTTLAASLAESINIDLARAIQKVEDESKKCCKEIKYSRRGFL